MSRIRRRLDTQRPLLLSHEVALEVPNFHLYVVVLLPLVFPHLLYLTHPNKKSLTFSFYF